MCFLFDGKVCNTSAPKMKKTPTPAGTCWALLFSKALKPARDTELPRSADLGREQATENSVACSGWRVPGCAKGQTRGVLQQMSCGSPQTIQCDDDAIKCHLLYRSHMPNCNSSYIYIYIYCREDLGIQHISRTTSYNYDQRVFNLFFHTVKDLSQGLCCGQVRGRALSGITLFPVPRRPHEGGALF